ncbi:DUF3530 family protein [Shewanella cyperi]|uniref:DUF3530 family protein n=1 Tax=Shewanella cyperi TaxID=2814292 RepID=A0A974XSB9_9GAMM|nr:DUF3530 family protein [Shewanella cyperi]QSX29574.1 DUF3530 family protein [Shewanella cyperi]
MTPVPSMRPLLLILLTSLLSPLALAETDQQVLNNPAPKPPLVQAWEGKQRHGAVILVADTGQQADSQGLIAYLHSELAPLGWASISVTPPGNPPYPNFATDPAEIALAGDGETRLPRDKATEKYTEQQLEAQLGAQLSWLEGELTALDGIGSDFPGKRVLLAQNRSAALVIKLLADNKLSPPNLLVVINPYSDAAPLHVQLPPMLAGLSVPVLDLVSPDAHAAAQKAAEARRSASAAKSGLEYRQQLLALDLHSPSAWADALQEIRGFAWRLSQP